VKIDDQVEAPAAQRTRKAQIVAEPAPAASALDHHHLIEVRISEDDGSRGAFHEIGEARVGKVVAQRSDGRGREHHVANEPQTDDQNVHQWRPGQATT
jgi:hypothetical protein